MCLLCCRDVVKPKVWARGVEWVEDVCLQVTRDKILNCYSRTMLCNTPTQLALDQSNGFHPPPMACMVPESLLRVTKHLCSAEQGNQCAQESSGPSRWDLT